MINWFIKHPNILQSECWNLVHDSNYKELYQKKDELLVSHGYIVVRLTEIHKFPILIVYPPAYPYVLPLIYPLNRTLTEAELFAIAETVSGTPPADSIKYYYKSRHQNKSGILCFLEWESFDDGGQFYGMSSILRRVRDWYEGHVTGNYPLDSEEIAYVMHFNNVSRQFQFIYPCSFVDIAGDYGEFYGIFKLKIPNGEVESTYDAIFWGIYLFGVGKSGISIDQPERLNVPEEIAEMGLVTSLDLLEKRELVDQLVEKGVFIHGLWFDVDNEPEPFQHFSELVELIGNGDKNAGVNRLIEAGFSKLQKLPDKLLIAIRFFNRKGLKEFQCFIVTKIERPEGLPLFTDKATTMNAVVRNYDLVEAVVCEKFTEDTFFQRNTGRADRGILRNHIVNIVGVGAIGSEIADCIAKAGVRLISLIDNQRLNSHNVVRHLAGMRHVGSLKVHAVASHLGEHNPFLEVVPIHHSVTACDISTELPRNSITISSIADDNTENFLNEQAVIVKRPMFYVRALRGGKAARIIRVIPGEDACLNCLRLYRMEKKEFVDIPPDPKFPTLRNECNNPILPASAADLKLIAALGSRILIDHIQEGASKSNHWIWTSEAIPGTPINQPYSMTSQHIKPHVKCQYCNSNSDNGKIKIAAKVLDGLTAQVIANAGIETGGVLVGYDDGNGNKVITHASGPGPNASRSANKFEKDVDFCQKFLDDLWKEFGNRARYLGEWHSHPIENNSPSNRDLKSLTAISVQKEYQTSDPIMIIFTRSGKPSCTIHPAGKMFSTLQLITTEGDDH